jgi:ketosteroid isomerase-like protein
MSEENVEIVRRCFDVVNRGDLDAIFGLIDEVFDPEVEIRAVGHLPDEPTVLRGREGVKEFWAQILGAFDWHFEVEEFTDMGDAVVVDFRQIARGRESGVEVANRLFGLARFREGKVIYTDAYRTKGQALEAAGLRE